MYKVRLTIFGSIQESKPVTLEEAIDIMKANFAAMQGKGEITIVKENK